MGRELRRVPLDFDWPLNERWEGFVNPYYKRCAWCRGDGYDLRYRRFSEFVRYLLLAAEDSQIRPENFIPLPPRENIHFSARINSVPPRWPWAKFDPVETLMEIAGLDPSWMTKIEEDVVGKLAAIEVPEVFHQHQILNIRGGERNYPHPFLCECGISDVGTRFHEWVLALGAKPSFLGWDGVGRVQEKIFRAVGFESHTVKTDWGEYEDFYWGKCKVCDGEGIDLEFQEKYENWESTEPPKGPGYQVWETVSEGSPVSPVFENKDDLVFWLVGQGYSEEAARKFSDSGWVPSMIMKEGEMYQNIEAAAVSGGENERTDGSA